MPTDHAPLAPSTRPAHAPALCWREVVHMALDGWRPATLQIETLIDRMEGAR